MNIYKQRFKSIEERFWEKVDKNCKNGCWEWLASDNQDGYGRFIINGRAEQAHRVSWGLYYGEIPVGLCVLHHCDNPKCVRPDHLFLGTKGDNMQDMRDKNRHGGNVGENNGRSKLSALDVADIKELYDTGNYFQRDLAVTFGVSQTSISRIVLGESWSHTVNE